MNLSAALEHLLNAMEHSRYASPRTVAMVDRAVDHYMVLFRMATR